MQKALRLKSKKKVERIKLEEVWISVPCKTYCKLGGGNRDLITPGYAPAGAMITR